jgi:ribonuclease HI
MSTIQIYTDGASRGNPGKSACSFLLVKDNSIIMEKSKYLGQATNNEAEYNAIILALETLEDKDIEILSDSELVVRQLNGVYKVRKEHLLELYDKVFSLIKGRKVKFSNVPRENKFIQRADFLVNLELDRN